MARFGAILRYVLAAATIVMVVLMAWQCLDIYFTGDGFIRENVAARLEYFAAPSAVYAVLAVIAAIIGRPNERPVKMDAANRLRLMKARAVTLNAAALREEKLRLGIYAALGAVLTVCAGFSAAFLLNEKNFISWNLEAVMGRLLAHVGPWAVAAFAAIIAAVYVCDASMEREAEALKGIPGGTRQERHTKKFPVNAVRICILAVSVMLIVVGVINGGMRDVLIKAINICTECIGLG